MNRVYLPKGIPHDLARLNGPRAPQTRRSRWTRLGRRLLRRWLDWLDRRAGWVPGPDGRLVPPSQPLVPPQFLLAIGQRHVRVLPPRKAGIARRVWASLFNRD